MEKVEVTVARIEERVKADRIATAVFGKHINTELSDIKLMLKQHFADAEIQNIQFTFLIEKIKLIESNTHENAKKYLEDRDSLQNDIKKVEDSLTNYKHTLKPFEWSQLFKRTPFIFFMVTWVLLAKDYITALVNSLIYKTLGQ